MRKIGLSLLLLFGASSLFAQDKCATTWWLKDLQANNPTEYARVMQADKYTADVANGVIKPEQSALKVKSGVVKDTIFRIPLVFHILYNTTAQNINMAHINAQVNKLNLDYNRLNNDTSNTRSIFKGLADGMKIEFYITTTDPYFNYTTGVNRIPTTRTSFTKGVDMKSPLHGGVDAWPNYRYCNIWVCNLNDGGILAYATLPSENINVYDGVVCGYKWIGGPGALGSSPADLGRTLTHEMGHWFSLHHIWGDTDPNSSGNGLGGDCQDDDGVNDTPVQNNNYFGCPGTANFPNSCIAATNDQPDMWENYMDYVDDNCMNMFSKGQVAKMKAAFFKYRIGAGLTNARMHTLPHCENFNSANHIPTIWSVGNIDGSANTWVIDTTSGNNCMHINNIGMTKNKTTDNLYTIGLQTAAASQATLDFDYAYAVRTGHSSDTLRIWYSNDNGTIWTLADQMTGADLATVAPTAALFTPSTTSDWKHKTVTITTEAGSYSTQYRLENISAGGNAVYVDNFCFGGTSDLASVPEVVAFKNNFKLYPNPAHNELQIQAVMPVQETLNYTVLSVDGKVISKLNSAETTTKLDVSTLSPGMYFLQISSSTNTVVNKFVVE